MDSTRVVTNLTAFCTKGSLRALTIFEGFCQRSSRLSRSGSFCVFPAPSSCRAAGTLSDTRPLVFLGSKSDSKYSAIAPYSGTHIATNMWDMAMAPRVISYSRICKLSCKRDLLLGRGSTPLSQ